MSQQPVKEGDVVTREIESFGNGGDPLFKIDGYAVFVKGLDPKPVVGDKVTVRIVKALANFAFAEPDN